MYQNTLWGIYSFIHISSNSPTRQKSTEADRRAQCYNHQNLDKLRIEIENYIVLMMKLGTEMGGIMTGVTETNILGPIILIKKCAHKKKKRKSPKRKSLF